MSEAVFDKSLPEHPDAIRRRLRDAGEWNDASKLYERVRRTYYNHFRANIDGGELTESQKIESNYAGWMAVLEHWPPPEGAVPLESLAEYLQHNRRRQKTLELPGLSDAAEARFDSIGDSADHAGEVIWVYHNLENYQVDPLDCPSRGAWTMLGHGRKDKGWFFEKMYRPVAQQQSKQKAASEESDYKPSKAEQMACDELRAMISDAVLDSQD